MHEYGHHYFVSKYSDKTEESADKYIRIFAQEMPLEEQFNLELFVQTFSDTPEITKKEYLKMYLQKISQQIQIKKYENT